MDGSNTMAIIHSSEVSLPVSLAIDNRGASSKLFVADSDRQRITVFDTNGKGQDLFKITDSPITGKFTLFSVLVFVQYLYCLKLNSPFLYTK